MTNMKALVYARKHGLSMVFYLRGWFKCTKCGEVRNGYSLKTHEPQYVELCEYCIKKILEEEDGKAQEER